MRVTRDPVVFALSVLAFVVFWAALSAWKADPRILPPPWQVLAALWHEAETGVLWRNLGATLARVAVAFGLSMAFGTVLGLVLGRHPGLDRWADPWVVIFLNMPALVIIVLCYLWIGLNEVAAVTAVTLNKTAMVLVTLREGTRVLDPALDEMARVYRLGFWQRLRHVTLPQLAPWFATAARNGLAVIWKIVLVVEFLGRSSGVGFQIHLRFQMFDIPGVMAWALAFVVVMLVIDYGVIQPWERRASAWRRPPVMVAGVQAI